MVLADVDQLGTLLQAPGLGVAAAGAKAQARAAPPGPAAPGMTWSRECPGLVMRGIDRSSPSV